MKYLTISIAAYNSEKWLETCLDSFLIPEIIDDIEVLIINDGSTDSTAEIASKYVSKNPDTFILINKENGGHGSTINVGIKSARGLYFKLVDADDWVEKDGLLDLINVIKNCSVDAIISPYYKYLEGSGEKQLINYPKGKQYIGEELIMENAYQLSECTLPTLTFKTDILQRSYMHIDEKCFYADNEYVCFYIKQVRKATITDIPVYVYRLGISEQSINIENLIKNLDQQLKVINRLIDFYSQNEDSQIVRSFVERIILFRYKVLISIPEMSTSKREILGFESFLQNKNSDLYFQTIPDGIKEKLETAVFVYIMRKTNYKGYLLFHFLAKIILRKKNNAL